MRRADLCLDKVSICKIYIADTFWTRFKGLMGKSSEQISDMGGLLIKPCSQIHTFFMKAPIDVVYLNKEWKVIYIDESVKPNKCCKLVKGAKCLVEFPEGEVKNLKIKENNTLEVI